MIVIPIISPETGENTWAIIELQGTLHNADGKTFNSMDLGTLEWSNGLPVLTIGNHLCEGKIVKLLKPIAILQKRQKTDSEDSGDELVVEAVITEKILFSNRPRPLLR